MFLLCSYCRKYQESKIFGWQTQSLRARQALKPALVEQLLQQMQRVAPMIAMACRHPPIWIGLARRVRLDLLKNCRKWCPETDSNRRHADFQSAALPTELSGHPRLHGLNRQHANAKRAYRRGASRLSSAICHPCCQFSHCRAGGAEQTHQDQHPGLQQGRARHNHHPAS